VAAGLAHHLAVFAAWEAALLAWLGSARHSVALVARQHARPT